jgi:glycosyltransferase involved in cell wall biosynthesis
LEKVEHLILSSNFNRWAGPNNHLLDLCNFLYQNLKVDLLFITHDAPIERTFEESINFPLLKILQGSKPTITTRAAYVVQNIKIIKKYIRRLLPKKIFVNASIDTLIEAHLASGKKVGVGYNVFFNNNSLFFHFLDRFVAKHAVSRIVAHSRFHKRLYLRIGIPKEKISVIPHCIDIKRIENLAYKNFPIESKGKLVIFYAGRLR